MKLIPIAVLMTIASPLANSQEDTLSAMGHSGRYATHIATDKAGELANGIEDAGHAVAVPTKEAARSFWGFLSDVGNGMEKTKAIATGDGLTINTSVYSILLRQAERDNSPLKMLQKERDERQYRLKRAADETDRLNKLSKEYKDDAVKFQSNIATTLTGIADTAKKLEGWDKTHQDNLNKLIEEHKKLGSLTAGDGKARMGSHTMVSLNEGWTDLEDFIKKSPDSAKKIGLDTRLSSMKSLLAGASDRIQDKENQIMASTAKINEYAKVDEKLVASDEATMKRQMVLGTLNNSVNNLINQAEYSKNRAQLAFTHFNDIGKELAEKGVNAKDVKAAYKKNINSITTQYNETPIGIYVNSQIAKAMGSVCDLVANQCKEGSNAFLFDFLDDSSRFKFKSPSDGSVGAEKGAPVGNQSK